MIRKQASMSEDGLGCEGQSGLAVTPAGQPAPRTANIGDEQRGTVDPTDVLESISDGLMLLDAELCIRYFNRTAEQSLGRRREDVLGHRLFDAFPEARGSVFEENYTAVLHDGQDRTFEVYFPLPPYANWYSVRARAHRGGLMVLFQVVTAHKQAEEALRARVEHQTRLERQMQHAQKLESLGVLAGGIAHDFNNLLTAILGNADLALSEMSPVAPGRDCMLEIAKVARRAADLCRQMLAYSGRGKFVVEAVDLSQMVEQMAHIIEATCSRQAALRWDLAPELPAVDADASQLRQVIMNLVLNASEAIGDQSGLISISTGVLDCDEGYLAGTWLDEDRPAGRYLYVDVADTGCGMDETTKARIFDPFFSTKFTGRGLGLAAVLGIVRGHKGAIKVQSEPQHGTSVRILLPARSGAMPEPPETVRDDPWRGSGTVLLVDDEEAIRSLGRRILTSLGFEAVLAADGREAVACFREHRDRIDCVILDLTMPYMNGDEAFRELRRIDPEVRVILSSGYQEAEATQCFAGQGLAGFIQKPYQASILADQLRRVLEP